MVFSAHVLTLYPEMFPGPLAYALSGKALKSGVWSLNTVQIRDFSVGKHHAVDDTPAGGGPGMVMRADVLAHAIDSLETTTFGFPRVFLTPRGAPLTQRHVRSFAQAPGIVLVCGRFEGVDERVIGARDLLEISLGDFILSGGELAAFSLLDAIVRLLPMVMGKISSGDDESFERGLLEYPHYTRPRFFEDTPIPDVLLSGNHKAILKWRQEEAEKATRERRPDLWRLHLDAHKYT